jgi:hypothetical protein
VAAVDIRERNNVDPLTLFIIQVAAVSCADTKVPETTVANQSLRKVGFWRALQLEVAVIGTEAIPPTNYTNSTRLPLLRSRSIFGRLGKPSIRTTIKSRDPA